MDFYLVKRYIIEEFEVLANSKEEAISIAEDPYKVKVVKSIAIKSKLANSLQNPKN